MKKDKELINDNFYHILNKSIAGFKIFNQETDFMRIIQMMKYYQINNIEYSFSIDRNLG